MRKVINIYPKTNKDRIEYATDLSDTFSNTFMRYENNESVENRLNEVAALYNIEYSDHQLKVNFVEDEGIVAGFFLLIQAVIKAEL